MPASPLPPSYQALRDALRRRLGIIADTAWRDRDPAAHLNALRAVSQEISQCADALTPPPPPDLAHYLHGQSLSKALAWLDHAAGDTPAPPARSAACAPKTTPAAPAHARN